MKIFPFCVLTFEPIITKTYQAPQNGCHNLSFVKNKHIWGEKMARKGPTEVIYNSVLFRIGLYITYQNDTVLCIYQPLFINFIDVISMIQHINTRRDCAEVCRQTSDCTWFSFDEESRLCFAMETCIKEDTD